MKQFPHLFEPIRLGNTVFKNRIFSGPLGIAYFPSDKGHIGDDQIAHYERKAAGGAATVSLGSLMADNARGAIGPYLRLDDPTAIPAFTRVATCIRRHGAVADAELQHCGANAYLSRTVLGNEIYGAVDCVNLLGMEIPAMPEEIILETIERFGDAAQTAKHCGFGMVTLHAGHGWLFNQFLGPENNRTDQWGGSMENRARIVLAIADNIKKKCGHAFPVNVRMSAAEMFTGGYDVDYGIEIAKLLDGHFDMINVSVGVHESPEPQTFTVTHPSMFLEDGCNVRFAAEVKRHVKHSKIAAVGALADPELMEEIIASGQADVVMVCRELMADPDMPRKAQCGRADEIRKCIRCFECFSAEWTRQSICCAVNPEIGFEREVRYHDAPPKQKKKVLVAGGGVGGLQAAVTAAERGHEVILCEKSDMLGGALRCERFVPFKQNLQRYLDLQAANVRRAGVEIRMNTEGTPELAEEIGADVIIAAFGARPLKPAIEGIDGANVMSAEYAYTHAEETGERVLVLGGGLSGMELAIYLAGLGKKTSILEMANDLNYSGNFVHSLALHGEFVRLGIDVITSTRALRITPEGVEGEFVGDAFSPAPACETIVKGGLGSAVAQDSENNAGRKPGERVLYPADTVCYALGQRPEQDAAIALAACAPEFYMVGDCLEPKNVLNANQTAYTIARDL